MTHQDNISAIIELRFTDNNREESGGHTEFKHICDSLL